MRIKSVHSRRQKNTGIIFAYVSEKKMGTIF